MSIQYTYIEAIGEGFHDVQCHARGDRYEDIVNDGTVPIPAISVLDQYIFDATRRKLLHWVDTELHQAKTGGIIFMHDDFQTDPASRAVYKSLSLITELGFSVPWQTQSGEFINLTAGVAASLIAKISTRDIQLTATAEAKREEINAMTEFSSFVAEINWN